MGMDIFCNHTIIHLKCKCKCIHYIQHHCPTALTRENMPASSGVWDHGGNGLDFNSVKPPSRGFLSHLEKLTDFRERWKPVWIHACSRWFTYSKCGAIIWHQHKQSPSLSLEVICQNHKAVSLILKNISTEAERNETNFSSSRAKYLLIESKYKEFPHKPSYLASAMFQTL